MGVDQKRQPSGLWQFTGALVAFGLPAAMGWTYVSGGRPFGWRGGEFAQAIVWTVIAGLAAGVACRGARDHRLRGLGIGLLIGGSVAAVCGVGVSVLFLLMVEQVSVP